MTQGRRRWFTSSVLIVVLLAFLGLSALPLIGGLNQPQAPDAGTAAATDARRKLEAEAAAFEGILQREPNNEAVLRSLLQTRLQLGDVAGSIAPLEKLAALKPEETDYSILLAQAKQRVGDGEGAARVYRGILDRNPLDVKALQGLAELTVDAERPQAAIGLVQGALDKAVEANAKEPNSADTLSMRMLLGQVYAELKRYDEAIAAYDAALKDDPKNFRPILGKAIVIKAQGDPQRANQLFATATSLAPERFKDSIRQLAAEDASAATGLQPQVDAKPGEPAATSPSPTANPSPSPSPSP
ncbi:MAG: tetratricopeptide repeat protein [Cyanophyceae cyanobacterium]